MGKKKAFALRLDEEVLDAIEKWASDEFRSVNGQIEWLVFQALKKNGRLRKSTEIVPDAEIPPTSTETENEN